MGDSNTGHSNWARFLSDKFVVRTRYPQSSIVLIFVRARAINRADFSTRYARKKKRIDSLNDPVMEGSINLSNSKPIGSAVQ